MVKGIYLDWCPRNPESSREYYDHIDLDDLDNVESFNQTREFLPASSWPDSEHGAFVRYNVGCDIRRIGEQIHVVVQYSSKNNEGERCDPKLREYLECWKDRDDDVAVIWGTNKIIIEPGQNSGMCEWTIEGAAQPVILEWKRKSLHDQRRRLTTHPQIRDEKFRDQIIDLDKMCVVSGETMAKALDAAHIIPAKDYQNDIPENGIALRADIHRLYDARMFVINPESGELEKLSDKLSEEYKNILTDVSLPEATLERVKEALQRKKPWT